MQVEREMKETNNGENMEQNNKMKAWKVMKQKIENI